MTRRNAAGGYGLWAFRSVLDAWRRPVASLTVTFATLLGGLVWPVNTPTTEAGL